MTGSLETDGQVCEAGEVPRCDGVKGLFGLSRNAVWSALTMGKGGAWEGEGGMAQEA